ncbi:hypothetical protein NDR87_26455 [Nocardia sp. CDC159]|uniref:Uncharacterized protein n=1 Tax=Nocardia pulmonis TaxID=2951408 RepID=A0A9X2E8U7_9NOCA|nr:MULTISPECIES: hypothetical protein [Nocardia]MCM6774990.1 hypothetical protein [Nocardia pulmonis]MCM6789921.1 hypothetical protein [Nocardia sp. CDC159]
MPAGVFVTVDGTTAEVEVPDPRLRRRVAARLVAAARPEAWRVELRTVGRPVPVYVAPTDVVDRAGFIDHERPGPSAASGGGVDDPDAQRPPSTAASPPPSALSEEPPRSGRGSSIPAWREFLTSRGIGWGLAASRTDLIDLWDRHNDRSTP